MALVQLRTALEGAQPTQLHLPHRLPPGLHPSELGPLLDRVSGDNPALVAQVARHRAPAARTPGGEPELATTALLPCSRHTPMGVAALQAQDLPMTVRVLSNGDGPTLVPGAEVQRVAWQGHGATRQAAIDQVDTPYVLLTVDDAIVLGRGCVRRLIHVLEGGAFDAVVARQIPWPDADPITRARLRAWTPWSKHPGPHPATDHVATLFRTETLRKWPLPDVPIAEDAWWSQGRRIGLAPGAPVLHSHARRPGPLYRRNRDIHAQLHAMGRPAAVRCTRTLIRALPGVLVPTLHAGPTELPNALAELLGQWRGAQLGQQRRP